MKSLQALGLVLLIIGGLLIIGVASVRPVGGALAICGAGLLILGWINPQRRAKGPQQEPDSEEDDEALSPQPLYHAQPGEVRLRGRPAGAAPEYTEPTPGSPPAPRPTAPESGGAEYTTGHAEVPAPKPRDRGVAEYTAPASERVHDDAMPPPLTASGLSEEIPADHDPYLPPMAPPPPPDRPEGPSAV